MSHHAKGLHPQSLAEKLFAGNERALAQTLTAIENSDPIASELLEILYPKSGNAYILGITGSPGAGKSTLVDRIAENLLTQGKKVAILAVDPSSPFSGGALLGDRIRMAHSSASKDVFIRSMASRGSLGGLGPKTFEAAVALDAAGFDYILVETVGVGQAEVEIVELADSVLVVLVPGMGDSVQAFKAGILEIADIFVINKSDYPGVDKLKKDLLSLLSLSESAWKPPIVEAQAVEGKGVSELLEKVGVHKSWAEESGAQLARRKRRVEAAFFREVSERAAAKTIRKLRESGELEGLLQRMAKGEVAPSIAAKKVTAD